MKEYLERQIERSENKIQELEMCMGGNFNDAHLHFYNGRKSALIDTLAVLEKIMENLY